MQIDITGLCLKIARVTPVFRTVEVQSHLRKAGLDADEQAIRDELRATGYEDAGQDHWRLPPSAMQS